MIRLRLGRICVGNLKQLLGDNAKALWAGFTTAMQQEESYTNSTVGNTVPKELKYLPSWFPKKVRDLLAWNNVYLSAAVFVAGNILFLLLLLDKVSLVSLLSYVAMLELALSFVFVQCSNLFVGFLGSEFYSPPSLGKPYVTEESLSQQLDQLIPLINSAIDEWKKILFCTDNRRTLKLWFTAYILAKLGRFLSFMSLLYLCFLYFFTVPIMYHTFQELVDSTYQKVETIAYQYWSPIQHDILLRLQKLVDQCPQRIRAVLQRHLQPLLSENKTK